MLLAARLKAGVYHYHDAIISLVILYLKWRWKARIIYDVHEPTKALEKTFRRGPKWRSAIKSLLVRVAETLVAGKVDGLILASPFFETDFARCNPNLTCIYNFPDKELFKPQKVATAPATPILVYQGHIAPERGILTMVEAVRILVERGIPVHLRLVGGWDPLEFRPVVDDRVERWGLGSYVKILDWVEHDQVPDLLRPATLGLAALGQEPVFQQAVPNKPFEYMALGIPIVGAHTGPMTEFVARSQSGVLIDNVSAESLAETIARLLRDPQGLRAMGENGMRAVQEKYNWSVMEKELIAFYRRTIAR